MGSTIRWLSNTGTKDWDVAANWEGGVAPGASDFAEFVGGGTYQVDIDTAVTVGDIIMRSTDLTLVETTGGSITSRLLDVYAGNLVLDTANTIRGALIDGVSSVVVVGATDALGRGTVDLDDGVIEASANANLPNALFFYEGTLAAQAGDKLTLSGAWTIETNGITFGQDTDPYGGIATTGTVIVNGTSAKFEDTVTPVTINVNTGTVESGKGAHSVAANAIFSQASVVSIGGSAVLDVGNFGTSVTLAGLTGAGTLEATGNHIAVTLSGADFGGILGNGLHVTAEATNTLTGTLNNTVITMGAGTDSLDLSDATGKFTLSAPTGSTATVEVGAGTVNKFTDFQDGHLTLDFTAPSGTHVTFSEGAGFTKAVVHQATGGAIDLFFYGVTSSAEVSVGNDGHGHLQLTFDGSAEIAPHEDAAMNHAVDVAQTIADAAWTPPAHEIF